ncbi:hypothetical protein QVD17_16219 [Tagetes erecta]|uniref:Uncharacterized protein n=1 Tax=Tagetes erecta TaxID=13708 RepID=A0AAD8P0B8_TARER|nr:hypothetical protein QVD17_16219 [Tagetes erecta]
MMKVRCPRELAPEQECKHPRASVASVCRSAISLLSDSFFLTQEFILIAWFIFRITLFQFGGMQVDASGGNVETSKSMHQVKYGVNPFKDPHSGSPTRSISLIVAPPMSLSPRNSRLKSPEVFIPTPTSSSRPATPLPPPRQPVKIPTPEVGLSNDSFETSLRLSNSLDDQTFPLVKIPPPSPPPAKMPKITPPTPAG